VYDKIAYLAAGTSGVGGVGAAGGASVPGVVAGGATGGALVAETSAGGAAGTDVSPTGGTTTAGGLSTGGVAMPVGGAGSALQEAVTVTVTVQNLSVKEPKARKRRPSVHSLEPTVTVTGS
jgi:hypothetical protein